MDHYGGAASGQGVAMGKGSRCYNPEGQRARGPEGQRARGPEGQAGVVMSWVVSLAGCGGTAGSHGGHETRRHRFRGPFPMGACLLLAGTLALAGCGSSSSSTVTINQQQPPEPEPELTPEPELETEPQTDDGGQTITQQQQQPPEPEPEPQSSGGGNNSNMRQSEPNNPVDNPVDNPVVSRSVNPPNNPPPNNPPVVSSLSRSSGIPEPKAIDNCGSINPFQVGNCAPAVGHSSSISGTDYSVDYTVNNNWYSADYTTSLEGKDRHLEANLIGRSNNAAFNPSHAGYSFTYNKVSRKNTEVTYSKTNGFEGFYSYKGSSGQITEDVTLKVAFKNIWHKSYRIEGYIGDSNGITMGGTNFGQIKFSAYGLPEDGQFIDKNIGFSSTGISTETGFNELRGSFKNDGTSTSFPTQVVGELKMKRFFDTSPIRNKKWLEYSDNLFKKGDNALAGVFVADKTNEEVTLYDPASIHDEGKLSMLYYGIWASENLIDNRIVFLEETTKFNPERTASDYTSKTYTENYSQTAEIRYKRENGFKGVYIYEGETGELTGDVDFIVGFNAYNRISIAGEILTDLEIGGYDLKGIAMLNGAIDGNTGVGSIDIDADGIDDNNTSAKMEFGDFLNDLNTIDRPTVTHYGLARKLRIALSPDGIQAQGSTPETYPSQIAGEVEINGFKIKASDGDNNTVVGVFVADKQ